MYGGTTLWNSLHDYVTCFNFHIVKPCHQSLVAMDSKLH